MTCGMCAAQRGCQGRNEKVGFASVHGYLPQGTPCNDGHGSGVATADRPLHQRLTSEVARATKRDGARRGAAAPPPPQQTKNTARRPCCRAGRRRAPDAACRHGGAPRRRARDAAGARDKRSGKPPSFWESLAPSGETRCAGRPISYLVCLLYGQTKITHSPRGLRRTKLPAQAEIESTNRAGMKKQKSESVNTDVQHVLRRASAAAHGNLRRCSRGERLRRPKSGPRTAGAKKRSAASGATQLALHRPRDRERSA